MKAPGLYRVTGADRYLTGAQARTRVYLVAARTWDAAVADAQAADAGRLSSGATWTAERADGPVLLADLPTPKPPRDPAFNGRA